MATRRGFNCARGRFARAVEACPRVGDLVADPWETIRR